MAYSDGEKAEALIRLAINNYNFTKTAEETGIPAKTLRLWNKKVPKNSVSELLDRAVQRMLAAIPEKMSPYEWGVALGILLDKWLIVQGEPTQRTETIQRQVSRLSDDEFDDILEQANAILSEAKGGGADRAGGATTAGTGAPEAD